MVGAHRGESQHRATALAEADALIDEDAPSRQRAALALAHARHFSTWESTKTLADGLNVRLQSTARVGWKLGEQMALVDRGMVSVARSVTSTRR